MAYYTPTLDGSAIFGGAVEMTAMPNPAALQLDSYPGLNGQSCLFGGTRGGTIKVRGRFQEFDIAAVNADIANLVGYNDGIARTLTDTEGNVYYNVVFSGRITPSPAMETDVGWVKQYECEFIVLSG